MKLSSFSSIDKMKWVKKKKTKYWKEKNEKVRKGEGREHEKKEDHKRGGTEKVVEEEVQVKQEKKWKRK